MAMGRRLSEMGTPAFPWPELRALVKQAPPMSAIARAVGEGREQHEWSLEVLRRIEYAVAALQYTVVSALSKRPGQPPKLIRFPWELPGDNDAIIGDLMTIEEANEFLGWNDNSTSG